MIKIHFGRLAILVLIGTAITLWWASNELKKVDPPLVKQEVVSTSPTPNPSPSPFLLDADKLYSEVQQWRTNNGYDTYKTSQFTCNAADIRVKEIQTTNDHSGFYKRYDGQGVRISENLGNNYPSEEGMVRAWENSPTHRENLEKDYPYSCIRCLNNKCVQIFSVR